MRSSKFLSFLKMCTLPESRKRPALRGFVGGRCALGCTSLYHSAIFERAHPDENAAKTPPNAAHSPAGVSTPHMLLQKRTQRLTWGHRRDRSLLATLCREFFNTLLFSRNVRRLKLLLIELLYD